MGYSYERYETLNYGLNGITSTWMTLALNNPQSLICTEGFLKKLIPYKETDVKYSSNRIASGYTTQPVSYIHIYIYIYIQKEKERER